jgi:hypothetical protein
MSNQPNKFLHKTNKGSVFQNKSENPSAPKWKGEVNVDGVLKELSMWENTDRNGNLYYTISVGEPWVKPDGYVPKVEPEQQRQSASVDEDIPF